jgi:eukaryotic-like serine/threonine-protein kinase
VAVSDPLQLSENIGGYVVESVLGKGGMGTVYLGKHQLLGRRAAVKVLAADLASHEELVSRFFHEAKVVNDVKHPNIVDVIDFVRTKERVAFIMEFLEGKSLDVKIKEDGPLKTHQAINVMLQIASGLSAMHEIGVVHRDLKPANVRFTRENIGDCSYVPILKILDFGIAKAADSTVGHKTQTGMVLGTPAYMAPEQVAGDVVSPASDVYAMGEILHELLTGTRLFQGTNTEIMRRKLGSEGPVLVLPEGTPDRSRLLHVIEACLAFNPTGRPTAVALIDALTLIREGLITSPPSFPPDSEPKTLNLRGASTPSIVPPQPAAQESTFAGQTIGPSPLSIVEPPRRSSIGIWAGGSALLIAAGVVLLQLKEEMKVPAIVAQPIIEKVQTPPPVVEPPPPPPVEVAPPEPPVEVAPPEPPAKKIIKKRAPRHESPAKAQGRLKVTAWTTAGRQVPAKVLVDGKPVSEAAPLEIDAKVGKRKVEIQARGFPPKVQEVVVKAGETAAVNVVVDLK